MQTFFAAFRFTDSAMVYGLPVRVQMTPACIIIIQIHDIGCPESIIEELSGI